jgi:ABC-type lipoprotein release transport system permease subunit
MSLGAAGIALLSAGVLAALVPAWRAGKVSPVEALRAE